MEPEHALLAKAYAAFNARNIDEVLTTLHPEVDWPNAWEGGYVHGHQGVRDYWTRQWKVLNPKVEPVRFAEGAGRVVVDVRTVVHDQAGKLLVDEMIQHVFLIHQGLIRSMEIRKPEPGVGHFTAG